MGKQFTVLRKGLISRQFRTEGRYRNMSVEKGRYREGVLRKSRYRDMSVVKGSIMGRCGEMVRLWNSFPEKGGIRVGFREKTDSARELEIRRILVFSHK